MKKLSFLLACISLTSTLYATVFYVTPGGSGDKSGSSWENAFDLTTENLASGESGDEFWVKAGTYQTNISYTERQLYGGFNGTETELNQRDWVKNPTILQGVEEAKNPLAILNLSALLDGFIIQDNLYAKATTFNGAGVQMLAKTVLRNCIVRNNQTIGPNNNNVGGGIFVTGLETDGVYPLIENCLIINNSTPNNGAGIQIGAKATLHIVNSTVANNLITKASDEVGSGFGCGIGLAPNTILIAENSLIYNNQKSDGTPFSIGPNQNAANHTTATVRNCAFDAVNAGDGTKNGILFAEKTACIEDLSIDNAPGFKKPVSFAGVKPATSEEYAEFASADYSLLATSMCIDKGNSEYSTTEYDLAGNAREINGQVDIGAYEYTSDLPTGLQAAKTSFNCYVSDGFLVLRGVEAGNTVHVYNALGREVISMPSDSPIQLPSRGLYIVQCGKLTQKVMY